eukprot:323906-Pleurochrysis_carterae.AAC.3
MAIAIPALLQQADQFLVHFVLILRLKDRSEAKRKGVRGIGQRKGRQNGKEAGKRERKLLPT